MADPDCSPAVSDGDFIRTGAADARTVTRFRHELSQWLSRQFELDAVRLNDVLLAVNEALTNAAEFAYAGLQRGTMTMRARYHARDDRLSVVVRDHGRWRHVDPTAQPKTRGRGIPLMRTLADRATISRRPTGTHVHLQFHDCSRMSAKRLATSA
ncbi:MAG TPA: ATP-binding protein [Candidatus Tectomicrobia bacterium]|nr:ATP-binding protein [Candidatus Tectomicrobia bacterium]